MCANIFANANAIEFTQFWVNNSLRLALANFDNES